MCLRSYYFEEPNLKYSRMHNLTWNMQIKDLFWGMRLTARTSLTKAQYLSCAHHTCQILRESFRASEENYSNQTILIYSECRGMKTLSRRGGRGVRFWAFLPSRSLYSTHRFCNMSQFVNAILISIGRNLSSGSLSSTPVFYCISSP